MPDRDYWESFFDPERILDRLGLHAPCRDVVEFGCGYGTFTLPAAKRITGTLTALDLDPGMLDATRERARARHVTNIDAVLRDFLADGTGLPDGAADFAMVFNILHVEEPVDLLREAYRSLASGGRLGVIHWNHDPETPRGPPLDIRPRPEDVKRWGQEAGFVLTGDVVDLPPYHYGVAFQRV